MRMGTKVVRAGIPPTRQGEPFATGVTFAGTYHVAGDPTTSPYTYGRYHNPTWTQYETALNQLEGGQAVAFASGMAAVAAVFGVSLRPGDVLVMPSDCYYTSRLLADGFFAEMGVEVRKASTAGNAQLQCLEGAKLLWLETPSNPGLEVCDIAMLAAVAHEQNILVAVDNTTATVLGQEPLALGADFSMASDTKALTGHSDLILGHVATRDPNLADRLRSWRTQIGAVPGPMEAWLAHRSLATLELRLERQCRNALEIARFLTTRREVTGLRYPGLPSDPAHPIATRQMRYFGPVVSFVLADEVRADRFLNSCQLVTQATSFGSVHTTAERRARWGGDDIPPGFIRFSVGCEDVNDLLHDVEQALDTL
ncbi:MAG: cystathionine gamma-lyase [Blastocatellia bacterium]|nr:cystathionine gamma-lyase [Blastocatellia bacterium]